MEHHLRFSSLLALSLLFVSLPAPCGQRIVTCSSNNMRRNYCNIPLFNDARLVKQRSGSPCIRGNTWGIQGNSIWVDRGCRAGLTVLYR
jgi:hypothetical protein